MSTEGKITCVRRDSCSKSIIKIGFVVEIDKNIGAYQAFKCSLANAINFCKHKTYKFYVEQGGTKVYVAPIVEKDGSSYLRTVPDGKKINNLESLPECSKDYKSIEI